ncbi:MAG TPA: A/G-specific adenine glycosylase [Pseudorhodoplanes sp.]|nr:A/G-specific adenine glycosylase [Pseudorhodoplanes sp.]HWV42877.1 A/G-specific adenine glycosylase [Pseudorhodoplanes sp.]
MTLANRKAATKRDTAIADRNTPAVAQSQAPAAALLAWYDRHRRRLPWRAENGARPDPYHVWLSEIMLQQTTVKAVGPYYARFLERWPTIADLAAERLEEVLKLWAGLGYYARARNLHACARTILEEHGGRFPDSESELLTLPGIGAYTAAAIAAIAFDRKATPVDGNIERVIARLYAVTDALPAAKPQIRAYAAALTPDARAGDFAQAMMDLGATICTPKKPACALCPWTAICVARRRGDPETFPRKTPKAEGRLRRGAAFVVTRADAALLVRTRPDKGLLAKMTEVPNTEWTHAFDEATALERAPVKATWRRVPGHVTHTFTHFPLELVVFRTRVANTKAAPEGMRWIAGHEIEGEAFPNVMRKVIAHALGDGRGDRPSSRSSPRDLLGSGVASLGCANDFAASIVAQPRLTSARSAGNGAATGPVRLDGSRRLRQRS